MHGVTFKLDLFLKYGGSESRIIESLLKKLDALKSCKRVLKQFKAVVNNEIRV